jgi:hypothetical protein
MFAWLLNFVFVSIFLSRVVSLLYDLIYSSQRLSFIAPYWDPTTEMKKRLFFGTAFVDGYCDRPGILHLGT